MGSIHGPRLLPPVQERRLPAFERALQGAVIDQIDVVRNTLRIINRLLSRVCDFRHKTYTRSQSNLARLPVPYTFRAPVGPTALGRTKIQFCHAESRPKMREAMVSVGAKRRFASRPISASGERARRLSIASLISSFQSSSSGAKVTKPSSAACRGRST